MPPKVESNTLATIEQPVSETAFDKINIETYLKRLNDFQELKSESWTSDKFCRYPNGYYINQSAKAASILNSGESKQSGRDTLSLILSHLKLYRALGTRQLKIPRPEDVIDRGEIFEALKLVNESLVIWTDKTVLKFPASDKALNRIQETRRRVTVLETLEPQIRSFFEVPKFVDKGNYLIQYSRKCQPIILNEESIRKLDDFLFNYFTQVIKDTGTTNALPTGLQHGDLHYRNIFRDVSNKFVITDIDLLNSEGLPFLDLIHFAVHLIRTSERTKQYVPFARFIKDRNYLKAHLHSYGFRKLASLWVKYYSDAYIPLYIEDQINWYKLNQICGDELKQIEQLKKEYRLCP